MKKVVAVLAVLLTFFMVGCAKGGTFKLSPDKDLPEFTSDFKTVFGYVNSANTNDEKINQIMGYLVSAYRSNDAESACEFIYEHNYWDDFSVIRGEISETASNCLISDSVNERAAAVKLTNEAVSLSAANVSFNKWRTNYSHEKTLEKPDFNKLQADLKTVINELSNVFYGKDIV